MHEIFAPPGEDEEDRGPLMSGLACLPVFFSLAGKRVVLAGGSSAVLWKAELCQATGAMLDVFSTNPCSGLVALARRCPAVALVSRRIEPEDFRGSLDQGVEQIQAANADVILMNMQYSPRTESMLDVSAYADVMRWVAQQHGAPLFDRLAIMHYWNDAGTFDLYTATKKYDMARKVHECIGRALASQIINAAHLDAVRMQTTR